MLKDLSEKIDSEYQVAYESYFKSNGDASRVVAQTTGELPMYRPTKASEINNDDQSLDSKNDDDNTEDGSNDMDSDPHSVSGDDEIFVGTESGKIIRLAASSIATSGRASIGSKAITLENGDFAFTASLAPQSIEKEGVQE